MTVQIQLTRGYVATVDDEDSDLAEFCWSAYTQKSRHKIYAMRAYQGEIRQSYMHRTILERILDRPLLTTELCDHQDGYGLNNTRSNLRIATVAQNLMNQKRRCNNQTGFKGVWLKKNSSKYRAGFRSNGKRIDLGVFLTPLEAHRAWCIAVLTHNKEFSNFGEGSPFTGWTLADFKDAA